MTASELVDELKSLGSESIQRIFANHGIPQPCFGVKVEYLKKIQKRIKKNYELSLALYDTGIYDAMYLAGLIADESKMTRKDLRHWAANATSDAVCSYAVAWVTAESKHGHELALEWIDSKNPRTAATGWHVLAGLVALKDDADLVLPELKKLLQRVEKTIHSQPGRVPYAMNSFVIALGSYVAPLTDTALAAAKKIGVVSVDMGNTSCKVPLATEYIAKVQKRGTIGQKRKTVRC